MQRRRSVSPVVLLFKKKKKQQPGPFDSSEMRCPHAETLQKKNCVITKIFARGCMLLFSREHQSGNKSTCTIRSQVHLNAILLSHFVSHRKWQTGTYHRNTSPCCRDNSYYWSMPSSWPSSSSSSSLSRCPVKSNDNFSMSASDVSSLSLSFDIAWRLSCM